MKLFIVYLNRPLTCFFLSFCPPLPLPAFPIGFFNGRIEAYIIYCFRNLTRYPIVVLLVFAILFVFVFILDLGFIFDSRISIIALFSF